MIILGDSLRMSYFHVLSNRMVYALLFLILCFTILRIRVIIFLSPFAYSAQHGIEEKCECAHQTFL